MQLTLTSIALYQPRTQATRATALSMIVGLHAALVLAFLSLGGMEMIVREVDPLVVQLIDAPKPRVDAPPPPVPLPNVRPPDIHLSIVPPDNLFTIRTEEAPPSAPAIAAAPVVTAPPSPAPPPRIDPPRADMAYLNNPPPAYPSASKRDGEQGRVMLRVRVSAEGSVEEVQLEATSGFRRLDEAAIAAVRRWRFHPAKMGERAVAAWAVVPISFSLHR